MYETLEKYFYDKQKFIKMKPYNEIIKEARLRILTKHLLKTKVDIDLKHLTFEKIYGLFNYYFVENEYNKSN